MRISDWSSDVCSSDLVGAATSGAELAILSAQSGHETTLVGRDVGEIPFRIDGFLGRALLVRLVLRIGFHRVLTVRTPIGRRARPKVLSQGAERTSVVEGKRVAVGVSLGGRRLLKKKRKKIETRKHDTRLIHQQ